MEHPYKHLVDAVQTLTRRRALEGPDGAPLGNSPTQVQALAKAGMNFANDSLHSTLCLQFEARDVALVCVYLAGKYAGLRTAGGRPWLELLDRLAAADLVAIATQILELVQPKRGAEAEAALKLVRRDLDEMACAGRCALVSATRPSTRDFSKACRVLLLK